MDEHLTEILEEWDIRRISVLRNINYLKRKIEEEQEELSKCIREIEKLTKE